MKHDEFANERTDEMYVPWEACSTIYQMLHLLQELMAIMGSVELNSWGHVKVTYDLGLNLKGTELHLHSNQWHLLQKVSVEEKKH